MRVNHVKESGAVRAEEEGSEENRQVGVGLSVCFSSHGEEGGDTSLHDQKHSLWRAISRRCGMSEVGGRRGSNLKMYRRQHQLIFDDV